MKDTIIVNDKSIPWLMVGNGFKIPSFNFSTEGTEVLGRAGSVFKDRQLKSYDFEIPLVIVNEWLSEKKSHDEVLNALAVFFDYGNAVKLKLKSQDWYWWAYFDGPIELSPDIKQFEEFSIKVKLLDPYKYSDTTYKNMALNDSVSVYNDGTARTYPIVKATALKDSTSFLISKNDEDYFMVGMSESAFKSTYKKKPRLLYDHFTSVVGWQYLPTGENVVIGQAGGIVSGTIEKTNLSLGSIKIGKEGTRSGDGWVGPVIKKSLPRTAQDFRATVKMRIKSEKKGVGKSYMYLFNERGEVFGAIGLLDGNASKNDVRAHFLLYDEYGESWEWIDTMGDKSKPLKHQNAFDDDYIYLEVSREGKVWSMKTWKWRYVNGKKTLGSRMNRTYTDRSGKYQKPIAQLGLGMYRHTKYDLEDPYIGYVEVNEILPDKDDVDLIIEKGDEIYIDMEKALVTINEKPALDEKDFGSDYFYLDNGVSELFIMPKNTFTTEVLWQDRFL